MQVIVPLAGKGTRLLPVTKYVPKPLIPVAGRPVLDRVMETLSALKMDELIFITGHLKEQVEEFVKENYDIPARFIEQKVQDGTAGAVKLAEPYVNGPVLIVFVDTLFDADLSVVDSLDVDGVIWAKEVEDYQRFGVVVTDDEGNMTKIVEKPSDPISKLANIGLYYMRDWKTLFAGINDTLENPANNGEWYLTDAFQYMIDQGRKIRALEVDGWYDCGKVETLVETNAHVLRTGGASAVPEIEGVEIVEPVYLGADVELKNVRLGPNVSVGAGTKIEGGSIRDSLVGKNSILKDVSTDGSLVGDDTILDGLNQSNIVASGDEVAPAR